MWQVMSLDSASEQPRVVNPAYDYSYQPFAWDTSLWQQGCAPLFDEDFDVSLIPPVTVAVPKFADCAGMDQCPPPTTIDISLYDPLCPTAKIAVSDEMAQQQREEYMHAFHFDAALDLASRVEY